MMIYWLVHTVYSLCHELVAWLNNCVNEPGLTRVKSSSCSGANELVIFHVLYGFNSAAVICIIIVDMNESYTTVDSPKITLPTRRVCFGGRLGGINHWPWEMNESVCSRSTQGERCKDSMKHDLAVKRRLLLNHSVFVCSL
jgi:hypothetical protein